MEDFDEKKYIMNKTEVEDMYEPLTSDDLREMYDKYNLWYSKEGIKEKNNGIGSMDKYI